MTAPVPIRASADGAEAAGAADALARARRLHTRLESLHAEYGEAVRFDAVVALAEDLVRDVKGDVGTEEDALHREIDALAGYIQRAKGEIAAIAPGEIPTHHIPIATDELDAVVQATEEATGAILDAADMINALADELEPSQAERLRAIVTSIYEASNFQDITGQRVTKVVRTLRYIEAKVVALARAFGEEVHASPEAAQLSAEVAADDMALLNGPQLPHKANTQDEIDALLASFD